MLSASRSHSTGQEEGGGEPGIIITQSGGEGGLKIIHFHLEEMFTLNMSAETEASP